MTLKHHIASLLYATWRFFLDGEKALKLIEPSGKGVLQSFIALAFVFPFYALITWFQFRTPGLEWFGFFHLVGLFGGYALACAGFAFLMFHAWGVVGPRHNYLFFLPLYNWGRLVTVVILIPYFALESFGLIGGNIRIAALVFTLVAVLAWKLSIMRGALGANLFHGILFVLFDVFLVVTIDALIFRVYLAFQ